MFSSFTRKSVQLKECLIRSTILDPPVLFLKVKMKIHRNVDFWRVLLTFKKKIFLCCVEYLFVHFEKIQCVCVVHRVIIGTRVKRNKISKMRLLQSSIVIRAAYILFPLILAVVSRHILIHDLINDHIFYTIKTNCHHGHEMIQQSRYIIKYAA